VQTQAKTNVLVAPQRAVTELQGDYQIMIVGEQNKVHVQPVKLGAQVGSGWIIENGVAPGTRVVVEGAQKAREGAVVNPTPFPAQTNPAVPPTPLNHASQSNHTK